MDSFSKLVVFETDLVTWFVKINLRELKICYETLHKLFCCTLSSSSKTIIQPLTIRNVFTNFYEISQIGNFTIDDFRNLNPYYN